MSVSPPKNTKTSPMFFCLFLTFLSLAWIKILSKWIMFSSAQRTLRAWKCFSASFLGSQKPGLCSKILEMATMSVVCSNSTESFQCFSEFSPWLSQNLGSVQNSPTRYHVCSLCSKHETPKKWLSASFLWLSKLGLVQRTNSPNHVCSSTQNASAMTHVFLSLLLALNPELCSKSMVHGLCLFLYLKSANLPECLSGSSLSSQSEALPENSRLPIHVCLSAQNTWRGLFFLSLLLALNLDFVQNSPHDVPCLAPA